MTAGHVRIAGPGDAAELVRLRALMLGEIGTDPDAGEQWRLACLQAFEQRLGIDIVAAVVPATRDSLAACAVAVVHTSLPGPQRPDGRQAHLLNVVTEPDQRRRGLGRACVEALLAELRQLGIVKVDLHASADGESIYRGLGFKPGRYPELQLSLR